MRERERERDRERKRERCRVRQRPKERERGVRLEERRIYTERKKIKESKNEK